MGTNPTGMVRSRDSDLEVWGGVRGSRVGTGDPRGQTPPPAVGLPAQDLTSPARGVGRPMSVSGTLSRPRSLL